jgi:hypothetical protein
MRTLLWLVFPALSASLLSACASSTVAVKPCCYIGPVTTVRLGALPVTLANGATAEFDRVFPGFSPQGGSFTSPLPFNEVMREDIIYSSLEPLLPLYDANGDGQLEKPEVLVLYAREAAIATGTDIRHFGSGNPVRAVSTANADIGGLVTWVRANRERMSERGQAIFRDLDRLGQDLRTRGGEGGGDGDRTIRTR